MKSNSEIAIKKSQHGLKTALKNLGVDMTKDETLQMALDKKADNARELGLDYEPENTLHWHALNYRTAPTNNAQAMFEALEKFVEATIKEALAQPEQEPVAWQYRDFREDGFWTAWIGCDKPLPKFNWREVRALYTTPPQRTWVGLTDEDDIDLEEGANLKDLVKAIEDKLKEKNT